MDSQYVQVESEGAKWWVNGRYVAAVTQSRDRSINIYLASGIKIPVEKSTDVTKLLANLEGNH